MWRIIPRAEANIHLPISMEEARQRLGALSGQRITVEEDAGLGTYPLAYRLRAAGPGWQIDESIPWFLIRSIPCRTRVRLTEANVPVIHLATSPRLDWLLMYVVFALASLLLLFVPTLPIYVPILFALLMALVCTVGPNSATPMTAVRHKRALMNAMGLGLVGDTGEVYRPPLT